MIWAPLGDRPPQQLVSGTVQKASMRVVPAVPTTRATSILGCSDGPLGILMAGGDRPRSSSVAGLGRCAPYECQRVRPMASGAAALGVDRHLVSPVAGGGNRSPASGLRLFGDRP